MKKLTFISLIIVLLNINIFAAKPSKVLDNDWRVLLEAQNCFDNLDYSMALNKAVQAKNIRQKSCEWKEFVLNEALTPVQIRKVGDSITSVLPVLIERKSNDAVEIIQDLLKIKDVSFFNNSMKTLVTYIKESSAYPEADFLCGKVYQIEGEYDLAMSFYDSAIKKSEFLDIQDRKYEILYVMADLAFQQNDFSKYEEYLLNILNHDEFYKNNTFKLALLRTIDSKKEDKPVEKFFTLYRANNIYCYKSYFLLSKYYKLIEKTDKAIFLSALSSLTIFTHIYDTIKLRNPQFYYTNLSNFFLEMQRYDDIALWANENNIWETFIEFSQLALEREDKTFAFQLLNVIKETSSNKYWQDRATMLLNKN